MIIVFDILAVYLLFIIISMIYESIHEVYRKWKRRKNIILSKEK
jgi:hypothetical protein